MLTTKDVLQFWDGNVAAMARDIGCSRAAPHQWGDKVPAERVLEIAKATGWRFTPHALRPDLYPNPTDGMPQETAA